MVKIYSLVNFFLLLIFHENEGTARVQGQTQLAFYINLQRAVIGPSATLTGR